MTKLSFLGWRLTQRPLAGARILTAKKCSPVTDRMDLAEAPLASVLRNNVRPPDWVTSSRYKAINIVVHGPLTTKAKSESHQPLGLALASCRSRQGPAAAQAPLGCLEWQECVPGRNASFLIS